MQLIETPLKDCFVLEPKIFGDARGFFYESFNQRVFNEITRTNYSFVQDNHSMSAKNVLRGLHMQKNHPQGKLVRVVSGEVFDVAVDMRVASPSVGKWFGLILNAENKKEFWVPPGFAHGFLVLSEKAEFLYKTTDYYAPTEEVCIRWDDPTLKIDWPLEGSPSQSEKDKKGITFQEGLKSC